MIRALAMDDEPLALRLLEVFAAKTPDLEIVAGCTDTGQARPFLDKVDVVFADINMPLQSGMDFVASLECPPLVVFTTAFADYAVDAEYKDFLGACLGILHKVLANLILVEHLRGIGFPPAFGNLPNQLADADRTKHEKNCVNHRTEHGIPFLRDAEQVNRYPVPERVDVHKEKHDASDDSDPFHEFEPLRADGLSRHHNPVLPKLYRRSNNRYCNQNEKQR